MPNNSKPTIVFLTSGWANVDENIREGKAPGGVPSVVRSWTTCLEHGWDVHVFIETRCEEGRPNETEELGGVKFHWITPAFPKFTRWLADRQLYGWFKIFWIISQLKMICRLKKSKVKPDIIYAMRSTFALFALIWAHFCKAKVVLRCYGTFLYDAWFAKKDWFTRIKLLGPLMLFKLPFDLLIMTNDGTQGDKVAKWAGFDMDKFWFRINGVNKDLKIDGFDSSIVRKEIGISENDHMIMTLGRLTYWKRIDRIINAIPDIQRKFPDIKLVIVGSGELRGELEKQVKKLKLENTVIFMGSITHEQVKYYLNTTDIFIMPNDVTNMCSTLIEALTAGCCVVTRDVGSTAEIVTDDVNAIVLKKEESEAEDFAKAIIGLFNSPERIERLKRNAYEQAMHQFYTWDERMQMEVDELKRLLTDG